MLNSREGIHAVLAQDGLLRARSNPERREIIPYTNSVISADRFQRKPASILPRRMVNPVTA